jgi:prolyl 4-hydroxylase
MHDAPEELRRRAAGGDAASMLRLGLWHATRTQWDEGRRWLAAADAAGLPDGQAWLALHALYGWGGAVDLAAARAGLLAAEQRGSAEACYQLAHFAWCDRLVPRDPARMVARLLAAAQADQVGALRALAMVYVRSPAQRAVSDACLARASALGDALATHLLAHRWRAAEDPGQREAAGGLFAAAAAAGLARASGFAGPRAVRIDAQRLRNLPMPQSDGAQLATPEVHCADPLVETYDGAWTDEECEYLIASAEPWLHRSVTVTADGRHIPHDDRTSSDASLLGSREDFVGRWLQARMTDRIGVPLSHAEHLVVLRYQPGQEYRRHGDWLPPGARGNLPDPDQPGQRVHTVFTYLCDVERGGATDFPEIGVRVAPRRGRIVHFTNLRADGSGDGRTVHAGMPVEAGEKWLATLWTRVRPCRAY